MEFFSRFSSSLIWCNVPFYEHSFVYFEMTVLPRSFSNITLQPSMTTLSVGLSTEEMPSNALVGAWQGRVQERLLLLSAQILTILCLFRPGSCGLCTTGQIFAGGEWCTPSDPAVAAYTDGATIGCLVYLDDSSAVDTWEGVLVNATATFNVNGFLVALSPMGTGPNRANHSTEAAASPGTALPKVDSPVTMSAGDSAHEVDSSTGSSAVRAHDALPTQSVSLLRDLSPYTLSIKVPAAEELYPTVTLHSPATSVVSRFSAEDIVASSRDTIGAPPDATVYAVDGSVIFE